MELTKDAKKFDLKMTIEFLQNGIVATVPEDVGSDLSQFGLEGPATYKNKKVIITSKAQLVELIDRKFFELYENIDG
jgi:hypothetical protein